MDVKRANNTIIIEGKHLYKIGHSRCGIKVDSNILYPLAVKQDDTGKFIPVKVRYAVEFDSIVFDNEVYYQRGRVYDLLESTASKLAWALQGTRFKLAHMGKGQYLIA